MIYWCHYLWNRNSLKYLQGLLKVKSIWNCEFYMILVNKPGWIRLMACGMLPFKIAVTYDNPQKSLMILNRMISVSSSHHLQMTMPSNRISNVARVQVSRSPRERTTSSNYSFIVSNVAWLVEITCYWCPIQPKKKVNNHQRNKKTKKKKEKKTINFC